MARRARHSRHRSDPGDDGRDRSGFRDAVDAFAARWDDRGRHVHRAAAAGGRCERADARLVRDARAVRRRRRRWSERPARHGCRATRCGSTTGAPHQVPAPADLVPLPPSPPPAELLHTTYDMWHSMGIDLDPYTRLYGVLRDRVLGKDVTPRSRRRRRSPTASPIRPWLMRSGPRPARELVRGRALTLGRAGTTRRVERCGRSRRRTPRRPTAAATAAAGCRWPCRAAPRRPSRGHDAN